MTTHTLRPYQVQSVDFLREATPESGRGLLLDMGMGKTASCLSALTPAHLPALVIAPKRVALEVWPAEVAKWRPDLSVAVAVGSPAVRHAAIRSGADIVVLTRDNLVTRGSGPAKVVIPNAAPFRTVILDELSSFKTHNAVRTRAATKICKNRITWGLTGTPAPNGLLDLFGQMKIIDVRALGPHVGAYRQRYFDIAATAWVPSLRREVPVKWTPKPGAKDAIIQRISRVCMSLDSEGLVDLPPIMHNTISVPLDPKTARLYAHMATHYTTPDREILAASAGVLSGS